MTNIRLATPADLPAILDLSNYYARTTPANFAVEPEPLDMWRRSFDETHERFPWLIATDEVDASFIGFAKASPWKGRCAYNWSAEVTVYVDPIRHGGGIGKALYRRLIEVLRAQGYRTLLGGITQPNEASVRLHESLGFTRVAMLERVGYKFGRWWDVGYWELLLNQSDGPPGEITPVEQVVNRSRTLA